MTALVYSLILALAPSVLALAPKAPKITSVDFSRVGHDSNGSVVLGNFNSYLVTWTDNSLDEEGFEVQIRAGTTGAFSTMARVAANSVQALNTNYSGLAAGQVVNFQVIAWKFNGSRVETSTSPVFSFTVPEGTVQNNLNNPTALTVTNVTDSELKLSWTDNSNSELYYQIDFREKQTPELSWQTLGFVNHSSVNLPAKTTHTLRLRLRPDTDYQFRVRATRERNSITTQPSLASLFSNTVDIKTLPMAPPVNLHADVLTESAVRLRWEDKSTNETSYEIQYRPSNGEGTGDFTVRGTVSEGSTVVDIPVPQGADYDWRVVALYTFTPTGATTSTTLRSEPSNIAILSTTFPAPSNLTATTSSGVANTVDLTWEDNSESEYGFNVYSKPEGTSTWFFARAVRDGVEKVSVNSRTDSNDSTGKPVFTTLEAGVTHDFMVLAVASDETTVSGDSNVASAAAKDGFTSRLYQPAQVGQAFSYQAVTTNATNRTDWNITDLPAGLTFDSGNGLLTGIPQEAGLFACVMTAEFLGGGSAQATLTLRVLRSISSPFVIKGIPGTTIGIKSPFRIPLADKFADADSETAVRLETNKGNIDIQLFPSLAPEAVANFLSYVNAGDYDNMVFHRLVSGFVLQGGSLRAVAAPRTFASIASRTPASNEPGISNLRGMVASAKVGARNSTATLTNGTFSRDDSFGYVGNPDSATTDFFVNLGDNASNLDDQNGGFTAFGRVVSSGMTVVDSIATLPTGSYLNNNTTSNYDPSLDKRIILDGSFTPFSGIPMNESPAPANMDLNKTIKVSKASVISPISYVVLPSVPLGVVNVTLDPNTKELVLTGATEGSALVRILARDLDGREASQQFNVTVQKGYKAPVITKHPVTQAVVAGSKVTFSVTATGTALNYQWRRKKGSAAAENIGTNASTFIIPAAQVEDEAVYDVVVSNGTTSLTSSAARLDLRLAPTVGTLAVSKLVEVGKPLMLTVNNVTGAPAPTFVWKRGTATVPKQNQATLNIPAAKLTDAGIYSATASNIVKPPAATGTVKVCVVDKAEKRFTHGINKTITFTAPVAGPDMTYRWKKNGVEIPLDEARHSGMEDPVLKIIGTQDIDSGAFTCEVGLPDGLGSTETGAMNLQIVTKPVLPQLTGINAPPRAFIGVYYEWRLPFSEEAVHTPTKFSTTGLPTGLKLNTATGVISGFATKAGVFAISATANNVAGTSSPASRGSLTVDPLPASNVGTFTGTISAATLNQNKGGRFDFTITDTGSYSGKIILGTESINAAGVLGIGVGLFDASTITYQSRITMKRKDKSLLVLTYELSSDGGYVSGVLTNGTQTASLSGFRQSWHATWNPCAYGSTPVSTSYNLGLTLATADQGKPLLPQGSGYLNMQVNDKGIATYSGRLPDGTTLTSSSMVGPAGESMLFLMLYKNTGSVFAQIDIGDTNLGTPQAAQLRVDGQMRWFKDAIQPATERNYQAGIPETFLTILGGIYYKPGTNQIILGLPSVSTTTSNTVIDFSEGGLSSAAINPDRNVRITTVNSVSYPIASDAKTNLSVKTDKGTFNGSFELLDNGVRRRVAYQGIIIPTIPHTPAVISSGNVVLANEIPGFGAQGVGYFLLPELLPSTTKSKINSGRVSLLGHPIIISTQPQDQSVNPGTDVSFSVAVEPGSQGTLTYRWRQNGNTIAGATSSQLNLGAAAETHQGDYDCVISNGSFTITSDAAFLNVNDPVSDITITRTPPTNPAANNAAITFTAAALGTTPLSYQWLKDGQPIQSATSSTYTIANSTQADSGSYTVTISNVASVSGVTSSANVLTVDPDTAVSEIVITRTPAANPVASNQSIVFTATAQGTKPLGFQWQRNGEDILGATASTYTIASSTESDSGTFTVKITNVVSTTGEISATNELVVSPVAPVTDVIITRTPPENPVASGTAITFTASAQGTGPFTYQWFKGVDPIFDATQSSYSISNSTESDSGSYTVTVRNSVTVGGVTSSANVLTVDP